MLQNYTKQFVEIWESCSPELPEFSKNYLNHEKLSKENSSDQFLSTIKAFRKEHSKIGIISNQEQDRFLGNTRKFFREGLDFSEAQIEMILSEQMIEATKSFVRYANEFDPDLNFSDIYQACRNMWIMNGLQLIMGIKVKVTPSVFAYSMLYPYTDNFIDDPDISNLEKMLFSARFRDRLSGVILNAENKTERNIFRLVEMIEGEYSRINYPEVFESLLDIHAAQTNSLKLIQQKDSISGKEILDICMTKGGASVLADGYLVAGNLTTEQKFFLFGYGAYLQLLDDLQDVDEDQRSGLMTIFSKSASLVTPLDELLNKTYWFGEEVMKSLNKFEGQHIDIFKSMMKKSTDLFLIEAIAQNPTAFGNKFVTEFENHSPFHFSFIRKRRENFIPYHGFLLTALEEVAFAENVLAPVG